MDAAMVACSGAATGRAVYARMVARRQSGRQPGAGAQYLDHPTGRGDRSTARRLDLHDLHEDRLGHLAVLPDAAGAGRDTLAAHSQDRAVLSHRDLAADYARRTRRVALY